MGHAAREIIGSDRPAEHKPAGGLQEWLASQLEAVPAVNQQKRPFDQSADLCNGIARGVVHAGEDFIEFLATPYSVRDALIGTGPMLDNAVNYYANTKASQISEDIRFTARYAGNALAEYSKLPPEKRGELLGGAGTQIFFAELIGEVAAKPLRVGTRELKNSSTPLEARDLGNIPEDLQKACQQFDKAMDRALEKVKPVTEGEAGIVQVGRLSGTVEHQANVQRIIDSFPPQLQALLANCGLKVKRSTR